MSCNDGSGAYTWTITQGEDVGSVGNWYLDWTLRPPSAPVVRSVGDQPNTASQARLGRMGVVTVDKRPDGVRAGVSKQLLLSWPARVDVRFWQYLRYKYVYGLPLVVDIPIFGPTDKEEMFTPPDRDDLYLRTYFAKERWWRVPKIAEVTYRVYKNGSQQVSGFTVDTANGSVTFTSALLKTDKVEALYLYSAPFIITNLTPNFVPGSTSVVVAPEVTLEELDQLPSRKD